MAKGTCCASRLKPHLPILKLLSTPRYSSTLKKQVLKHCSDDCIHKICEIVYNLLKGNVPLSPAQKKKISPKKHVLRRLVRPQSVQRRRALLVKQKGVFLLPLLAKLFT